jgi:serine/threonine protein phosphatase 1
MSIETQSEAFRLPRAIAAGVEIFAIGDIHGRPDLLAALLDAAVQAPRREERREIVFLGDLIDRGPDSLGAIDLAIGARALLGADETVALMGNHETMMRMALDPATPPRVAAEALRTWIANGGDKVLAQFVEADRAPASIAELLGMARACVPARLESWLAGLTPHARSGDILFVHAGVNPRYPLQSFLGAPWNTPLSRLDENRHWAWVRAPFLDFEPGPSGWDGYFVVHGHTPNDAGHTASHAHQIRRFRLNLDGGSAMTGVAKMAILRADAAEVVTVRGANRRGVRG